MFCSENMGEISYLFHPENIVLWSLPNVFVHDPRQHAESCICSPWFSFADDTWRMVVIRNNQPCSAEYLGLFLWKRRCISSNSQYCVQLGLKNHKGDVYNSCEGELDIFGCFGKWNFYNIEYEKRNLSPNGLLNFFCKIRKKEDIFDGALRVEDNVIHGGNLKKDVPETKGVDRLVQNLKNVFLNGQSSDVVLKAEDRQFQVHKMILVARSPVFASMFQHEMEEKTSGVVDIPDCPAAAFEVFLLYLYTGSAENMSSNNVCNLYYAADKYQVDDLKAECVEYMTNTLSVDTFCDVMTLSLQHGESNLQKAATCFFCENVKKVIKTVQWQRYVKEYPTEANELYIKAINA